LAGDAARALLEDLCNLSGQAGCRLWRLFGQHFDPTTGGMGSSSDGMWTFPKVVAA
jgi:hypothetical protein